MLRAPPEVGLAIPEAKAAGVDVGAAGWAKLDLAAAPPGRDRLARWITESRALVGPKPKPAKPGRSRAG